MELQITTAGANLLNTQEAVSYLNLADAGDYPELSTLIGSVQELAESYTGKSFTARTIQLRLDSVADVVRLPRGPVISITSVKTLTEAGAETVISSATYYLADDERLIFTTVPDIDRDYGGVLITYVAGASARTPTAMKSGMLQALSTAFEHREDYVVGHTVTRLPETSHRFLDTWARLC
jgi:uncharacterized phiE125 gp8 family phage protein